MFDVESILTVFSGEAKKPVHRSVDSRTLIRQAQPEDPTTKCRCTTAARGTSRSMMIAPKLDSPSHRRLLGHDVFRSRTATCTTIKRASGIVSLPVEALSGVAVAALLEAQVVPSATDSGMRLRRRRHRGTRMAEGRLDVVLDVEEEAGRNAVVVRIVGVDAVSRLVVASKVEINLDTWHLLRQIFQLGRGICHRRRRILRE